MDKKQMEDAAKQRAVADMLEGRFPGLFDLDRDFSCLTYSARAEGVHACEYKVHVQPSNETIDVFATAPLRFTKESVGITALTRVNEYLDEASLTGLCSVSLDRTGRLCAQHQLFNDENDLEEAARLVIGFLDCNVLSLLTTALSDEASPRELAYRANRRFVAEWGNGIRETLKACFSRHASADSAVEQDVEEGRYER